MEEIVFRRRKVVALPRAREGDDGDAGSSGGVELEQAPRTGEDLLRLEEDNNV